MKVKITVTLIVLTTNMTIETDAIGSITKVIPSVGNEYPSFVDICF